MNIKMHLWTVTKNFLISYGLLIILVGIYYGVKGRITDNQEFTVALFMLISMHLFELLNLKQIIKRPLLYFTITSAMFLLFISMLVGLFSSYGIVGGGIAFLLNFILNLLVVMQINKNKES